MMNCRLSANTHRHFVLVIQLTKRLQSREKKYNGANEGKTFVDAAVVPHSTHPCFWPFKVGFDNLCDGTYIQWLDLSDTCSHGGPAHPRDSPWLNWLKGRERPLDLICSQMAVVGVAVVVVVADFAVRLCGICGWSSLCDPNDWSWSNYDNGNAPTTTAGLTIMPSVLEALL